MDNVYKCSCGKAYRLEPGKKYRCKHCGAMMALSQEAPKEATPAPSPAKQEQASSARPQGKPLSRRPQRPLRSKHPLRSERGSASNSGATNPSRPSTSIRSRSEKEEVKPGMPTPVKAGIIIGVAILLGGTILIWPGDEETNKEKSQIEDASATTQTVQIEEKPVKKEIPPKQLSAEEFADYEKELQAAMEAGDVENLRTLLTRIKEENWQIDRKPLHMALLHIDPFDPAVTADIGKYERDKLNYDEMTARLRKAEDLMEKPAFYDVLVWAFENDLYENSDKTYGLDWHLIYKKIFKYFPEDHEAQIYKKMIPYDGPIQEYKGTELNADDFQDVKVKEWKLYQEGVGKFPFPLSAKGKQLAEEQG